MIVITDNDVILNATIKAELRMEYEKLYADIDEQGLLNVTIEIEKKIMIETIFEDAENMSKLDHKRNLVQIRKIDRLDNFNFKIELSDMFWGIDCWPPYAVKILFTNRFSYQERLVFGIFLHGNGMRDTTFAVNVLKMCNRHIKLYSVSNQNSKIIKFISLFDYLDKSNTNDDPMSHHIRSSYYYYDMRIKHMVFYSGELRNSRNERQKITPYNLK